MKAQSLLLDCVLVTSELKEHTAPFFLSVVNTVGGVARECVEWWRDRVDLREEDAWTWCPDGCESHARVTHRHQSPQCLFSWFPYRAHT